MKIQNRTSPIKTIIYEGDHQSNLLVGSKVGAKMHFEVAFDA